MCNLASEGGRCHAHITQKITRLKLKDGQNLLEEAANSGVEIDDEQVYQSIADYDYQIEEEVESVEEAKQAMLEAHAEALEAKEAYKNSTVTTKEMFSKALYSDKFDDARDKLSKRIGGDDGNVRNPQEIREFGSYPDRKEVIDAYQYKVAAEQAHAEQARKIREAREAIDKQNEKTIRNHPDVVNAFQEYKAAQRQWKRDSAFDAYERFEKAEATYNKVKAETYKKEGIVTGGETPMPEEHALLGRIERDSEEAKEAYRNSVQKLYQYAQETNQKEGNWDQPMQNAPASRLENALRNSRAYDTADYDKSRALHKIKKFNEAKTEYMDGVNAVGDEATRYKRRVEQVAHIKRYTFDEAALKKYKETDYRNTDSAKQIKAEIDAEQRELVLTPTYRRKMNDAIIQMERTGRGSEANEARKKLARLDQAAERRKMNNANNSV